MMLFDTYEEGHLLVFYALCYTKMCLGLFFLNLSCIVGYTIQTDWFTWRFEFLFLNLRWTEYVESMMRNMYTPVKYKSQEI